MALISVTSYDRVKRREQLIVGRKPSFVEKIVYIAQNFPTYLNDGLIREIVQVAGQVDLLPGQEGKTFHKVVMQDGREIIVDNEGKAALIA